MWFEKRFSFSQKILFYTKFIVDSITHQIFLKSSKLFIKVKLHTSDKLFISSQVFLRIIYIMFIFIFLRIVFMSQVSLFQNFFHISLFGLHNVSGRFDFPSSDPPISFQICYSLWTSQQTWKEQHLKMASQIFPKCYANQRSQHDKTENKDTNNTQLYLILF